MKFSFIKAAASRGCGFARLSELSSSKGKNTLVAGIING